MRTRFLKALRRLRSEESGQSLVIMGVALFMIIGVAALAIDTASWEAKRHRDQVVADSAALAAANCLANPTVGLGTTAMPLCSSNAAAQQVAVSYAAANGLAITNSQVTFPTTGTVKVQATSTSPSYFAKLFGFGSPAESATATAGYAPGASGPPTLSWTCTTAQQNAGSCDAIYAADTTCGSTNGWYAYSASMSITGTVHSQGSINVTNGSFAFNGPISYTSPCTFGSSSDSVSGNTPTAGASQPWPADFRQVFTNCGAGYHYQCTGPNGTPSYCTYAAASFTFNNSYMPVSGNGTIPNGVYCAYGSTGGVDVTKPSTWTGAIQLDDASTTVSVTLIGGSISAQSGPYTLSPYSNDCLMYATDTNALAGSGNSNSAIYLYNSNYTTSGGIFAPNGTITEQGTAIASGFTEGLDVVTYNGSFADGNGPSSSSGATLTPGGSSTGSDNLAQ